MRTAPNYCDRDDLNLADERLVQLTDSNQAPGVINLTLVDKAIADACDYIDGSFEWEIPDPAQPHSRHRGRWSAWIARYYLFDRRDSMEMPDTVVRGYKEAKADLDKAASSPDYELGAERADADTAPSPSGGALEENCRHFGRGRDYHRMSVLLRHTFDSSRWDEGLREAMRRASDLSPVHRQIGDAAVGWTRRNFDTQGINHDWAPLSPATLIQRAKGERQGRDLRAARRPRRAGPVRQGLARRPDGSREGNDGGREAAVWSGRLLRSMTYLAGAKWVDVGSNLVQAARLFFGSASGVPTYWNGRQTKPTPARNPFGLTPSDEAEVWRMYVDWLWGAFK
jgi:phage gp36-like protein/phage gpG-like protein